jgi:cell division septum initiation protein DivIVA
MNEHSDLLPNLQHEEFEMQMRGYSRRQVDDYVARRNAEARDLEHRLARALDESEHLRREISTVRQQALAGRPAHEEVSERIGQILKLAEDEAKAQRTKTDEEISGLRAEAQQESDRVRTDAREQAERMLTAAQEQAERTISAARTEADKLRGTARSEADRLSVESRKQADAAIAEAKAQAKRMLDEATARASAIHDGAERRLNLLSTRHAETVRRLTDILDGVQGLVAAEAARMSLEDEVNQSVSTAIAALEPAKPAEGSATEQSVPVGPPREQDRALLAPPPLEKTANGTSAPPVASTDSGPMRVSRPVTVHPVTLHPDPGLNVGAGAQGPADIPAVPDTEGTGSAVPGPPPTGRHATPLPPPPAMPRRLAVPPAESSLNPLPIPGAPLPGPATMGQRPDEPYPGGESQQGGGHGRHPGLIDPDEPTEGLRLMN